MPHPPETLSVPTWNDLHLAAEQIMAEPATTKKEKVLALRSILAVHVSSKPTGPKTVDFSGYHRHDRKQRLKNGLCVRCGQPNDRKGRAQRCTACFVAVKAQS
jgi:hypothetical protein